MPHTMAIERRIEAEDNVMEPVIETQQLTRHFNENVAVDQLTFTVYRSEIFGFLGHNGAGKTTTIRLLNGILRPNQGTVRVLGYEPLPDGPQLRQQTGVLTENPALDERLTGQENLLIYANLFNVNQPQHRVAQLLDMFELTDRALEKVGGYSKGMKQRIALARALLHKPDILFLDEPTSALDPVSAHEVHQLITRWSRDAQRTVFLCTHNLVEAQRLCDRIGVMEHGRLIAIGQTAELARTVGLNIRLEIEVAANDVGAARQVVQKHFTDPQVKAEENKLYLTGSRQDQIPEIIARLVEAQIRIFGVTQQEASLEDIYFALHQKGEVT